MKRYLVRDEAWPLYSITSVKECGEKAVNIPKDMVKKIKTAEKAYWDIQSFLDDLWMKDKHEYNKKT